MDFSSSSHLKKWIFSEEGVRAAREKANEKGVAYVIELRKEHGEPVEGLSPLTFEQEATLCSYYTQVLAEKGRQQWDPKVIATAVTFVKRFFLHHSCIEHEVVKIVFTCLYIAGKVCERYIDADSIGRLFPSIIKPEEVLALETMVLGGLDFDLVVYQPYHYISAMIEELRMSLEEGDPDLKAFVEQQASTHSHPLQMVAKLSRSFVDSIIQSDAVLIMTPQQQALCGVCHALHKFGMPAQTALQRYARLVGDAAQQEQAIVAMQEVLNRGAKYAAAGHSKCGKEVAGSLDKRNRTFNPLMDKSSKLYRTLKKKKKKRKREEGQQQ